ncbi:MAG TPA: hypothetical protein VFT95_16445 [Micromonosporaceae bacterium]|nr:hypothetical protein [Micromonosporaceae bacterium]
MGPEGGRLANLLGSLAVLMAAGAIAIGLPALDRALPAARPVPADLPYEVGGGVSLMPPPGALIDVTKTRPGRDRGTVLFLIGAVRFVIVAAPFPGTLSEATARLRSKITATRGYQVAGPESAVSTRGGLIGRGGGYAAPGRTGRYSVFLVVGMAIEVTVSGGRTDLSGALAGVSASIDTLTYTDPSRP